MRQLLLPLLAPAHKLWIVEPRLAEADRVRYTFDCVLWFRKFEHQLSALR